MPGSKITRGDVWDADLNPSQGHEQAGKRPVLVVSVDALHQGPSELVIVVPITSKDKRIRSHIPIKSGEGGLVQDSFGMTEAIRSISTGRLVRRREQLPRRPWPRSQIA